MAGGRANPQFTAGTQLGRVLNNTWLITWINKRQLGLVKEHVDTYTDKWRATHSERKI
jgi:hypothetical protein